MTKVVSDIQHAANKQNAPNATGPTTPEAQARTARNALKHGPLARDIVVDTPPKATNAAKTSTSSSPISTACNKCHSVAPRKKENFRTNPFETCTGQWESTLQ